MRITAAAGDIALDLILEQGKPPVLHGEAGLSRKGPEPGNASYYYSLTSMPTRGTIRAGGRLHAVQGASWMDREWSTSALSQGIAGWDWFALQLDDGTELMLYQLRREEGGAAPHSAGSFIGPGGDGRSLSADAFSIEALAEWRSPTDGTRYPARWRVRVPQLDIDLAVSPVLAEQELNLAVRYWEGAVDVSGTRDGRQVTGVGYVELTGYADTAELGRGR
jgi:predicted secreted hydrolase